MEEITTDERIAAYISKQSNQAQLIYPVDLNSSINEENLLGKNQTQKTS